MITQTYLVGGGEDVVVLWAKVSGPRVEHLDHLSTAVHLPSSPTRVGVNLDASVECSDQSVIIYPL